MTKVTIVKILLLELKFQFLYFEIHRLELLP
jgi:hypothetical protein